jgi:hypothetical protein
MLTAILDVLKDYEEEEFEEVLKFFGSKVSVNPTPSSPKAQNQSQSQPVIPRDKSTFAMVEVLKNLKEMDRDETKVYLNAFTKNQLLEISSRISIKPRSKDTKSTIITIIAEYFGFLKLNQQIASRGSNMSGEIG